MTVNVTLSFPDIESAAAALARLSAPQAEAPSRGVIAHEDRPDVGAMAAAFGAFAQPDLAAIFGGAAAQNPPPLPALSTAAAAALPTVPAVPQGTSPLLPPAASAPAPAPVLPAVAPTAPAVQANPADAAPSRDSAGMPWDARIHASTKTTNKDGTWRGKRDLDPAFKAQVEGELRAALGLAPAPVLPPIVPAAAAPQVPGLPPVAAQPVLPPAAAQPAPAAAPQVENFAEFMARMAPHFTADAAGATAKMSKALQQHGLTAIGQLSARPDLIPAVAAVFEAA